MKQFKAALSEAAAAAFACAADSARPEELQNTLSQALHANATSADPVERVKGKDIGAYGADLAVQVLALGGNPPVLEVDFRFGLECGDDNLLLLFQAKASGKGGWERRLQWGDTPYDDTGDALGGFVLLTPLTGNAEARRWRYVVAHGRSSCKRDPHPSRWTLDLLAPGADPAAPAAVDWHLERAYTTGRAEPRLQTTEDSIEFRFTQPKADTTGVQAASATGSASEVYRFHLAANGKIEPGPSTVPTPARDAAPVTAEQTAPFSPNSPH